MKTKKLYNPEKDFYGWKPENIKLIVSSPHYHLGRLKGTLSVTDMSSEDKKYLLEICDQIEKVLKVNYKEF